MQESYVKKRRHRTLFQIFLICFSCILVLSSCSRISNWDIIDRLKVDSTVIPIEENKDIFLDDNSDYEGKKDVWLEDIDSGESPNDISDKTDIGKESSRGIDGINTIEETKEKPETSSITPIPEVSKDLRPTPKPTKKETISSTPTTTPKSKDKNDKLYNDVKLILQSIISEGLEDVEKVKLVHDYIVLNTEYDYDNLINNSIPEISFTAEGVLKKGVAVCQGYAYAFQLFMEQLKIDSKVVVGTSLEDGIGHAWNMVSLNGKWYHIDTTWDDPVPNQEGMVQYKYFLVTDKVLAADHGWNKKDYPVCDSVEYQYYIYKDYIVETINNIEDKFMEQYDAGSRTITVLYPEEGMPSFEFFYDYDYLWKEEEGRKSIYYSSISPWRLGDYTVLTVMMD